MFINLYIARPTYYFILMYTCGLTVVIKQICYAMLHYVVLSNIDGNPRQGPVEVGSLNP